MHFDQKLELGMVLSGGAWSLATVLFFAGGKPNAAYTMLAIGTVVTTSIALVRIAASPTALPEVVDA
jgi:hypothetical protein